MPFKKTKGGKYKSPSGRTFSADQVKLYYANGGQFPGEKRKAPTEGTSPFRSMGGGPKRPFGRWR